MTKESKQHGSIPISTLRFSEPVKIIKHCHMCNKELEIKPIQHILDIRQELKFICESCLDNLIFSNLTKNEQEQDEYFEDLLTNQFGIHIKDNAGNPMKASQIFQKYSEAYHRPLDKYDKKAIVEYIINDICRKFNQYVYGG